MSELRRHPIYSRYSVSDTGKIFSHISNKFLKPGTNLGGYYFVRIFDNERNGKSVKVSVLVLETFVSARPKDYVAAHLNGDKKDDRLLNLNWTTQLENEKHKILHGSLPRGEKHGKSKLTSAQVLEIRRRFIRQNNMRALSDEFKIHRSMISLIVNRKIWTHI